jgi:hypothetical protein
MAVVALVPVLTRHWPASTFAPQASQSILSIVQDSRQPMAHPPASAARGANKACPRGEIVHAAILQCSSGVE